MVKFLKKVSFFIAILAIVWLCFELFYRFAANNYTEKSKNISTGYKDCEVLILGNSHTFYGLNPDFFKRKAFNLANKSQTLFYDQLLLEKYIDSLNALKYVIIPVEYSSLSASDDNAELAWRSYFYESQMGIDTKTHKVFDLKKYSRALPPPFLITLKAIKKYCTKGSLVDCQPNGWAPYEGMNSEHNNKAMGKIIAAKHEDNSVDFNKNIQRLKSMVVTCRQKGVKVFLVTMPVTSYYADNINRKKLALITAQCNAFANENKIHYINLFQDKRFVNADFFDIDHLNTNGAKKCTRVINNFVK
jgi:hypothetical protein